LNFQSPHHLLKRRRTFLSLLCKKEKEKEEARGVLRDDRNENLPL
jgi:hypothetical protein